MRILFVSHYALPHVGGVETGIAAVAAELSRRGHEVTHLASAARRPGEDDDGEQAYRVIRVPAANVLERRLDVPYPLFSPRLAAALRAELPRADAVHAHGFLYASSAAALRQARRASESPVRVLTEHVGHVPYSNPLLDAIERAAERTIGGATARNAEAVVTYNDRVAQELAALAPNARQVRIANGVDTERYRRADAGEHERLRAELGWDERPRVLLAGRGVAKKGLGTAVEAAARAGGSFELVLAGPGLEAPRGAAHVAALGALRPDRLADVYRAADVFVLPSAGEGFPLSVQEAMASGLPVVLADDPAYAASIAGAGPGVRLVAPTPEAVANAIAALTADPAARAAAGEAAERHARTEFSWSVAADAHERLYDELAEARR